MKPTKMTIRWVPGAHGGWTAACNCCASVAVRDTWDLAMAHAIRHRDVHRDGGPFVIEQAPQGFTLSDLADAT